LIDPDSLALCPSCGWCRSLVELTLATAPPTRREQRQSVLGWAEFVVLLGKTPGWVWLLGSGVVGVGFLTGLLHWLLPAEGLPRALWTTGQAVFGLALVLVAQTWALVLLAPRDDSLGARDLFLSGRLWPLTVKRLPATQWPVALAAWGLTLALGAVGWIGGLSYWLPRGG
jgi:hypothetical protein